MVHMKRKIKKISGILIPGFIVAFFFLMTQAVAEVPVADTMNFKEVEGEVTLVIPDVVINVEFERTETGSKEIVIPLGGEIQFTHLIDVKDIQLGDIVKVTYKETYKEGKDGKRNNFKRVATGVSLVRRATPADALSSTP